MSDTTAKPEFCSHCGNRLGAVRYLIVGSEAILHQHCVDGWRAKLASPPHGRVWTGSGANVYDRDGYCDNPARGF